MGKIIYKIKHWFGYHNGPVNIYTGRGFAQGAGFNVYVDSFEVRGLGIKFIKGVKVDVDPQWFDTLKNRLLDEIAKQK